RSKRDWSSDVCSSDLIVIATILFTCSAWSGIDKGIKSLSNINMFLAFIVLIILFCVGPTLNILNTFTNSLGDYIANFFNMSLRRSEERRVGKGGSCW